MRKQKKSNEKIEKVQRENRKVLWEKMNKREEKLNTM